MEPPSFHDRLPVGWIDDVGGVGETAAAGMPPGWDCAEAAWGRDEHGVGGKDRGLLEAAPDAMVVVSAAGEIVLLNLQAEKQFGYHHDELVGQKVTNIIPEGFAERLIAADLRSAADALAQQPSVPICEAA